MIEIREIPGFPGYRANSDGRIWSDRRQKYLKPGRSTYYPLVLLHRAGRKYGRLVHRLVLETFVGPRPAGMECRHLDGNPHNNRVDNLCWGTHAENIQDAVRMGLRSGEKNGRHRLRATDIPLIRSFWWDADMSQMEIARGLGVTNSAIWAVLHGRSWKVT